MQTQIFENTKYKKIQKYQIQKIWKQKNTK